MTGMMARGRKKAPSLRCRIEGEDGHALLSLTPMMHSAVPQKKKKKKKKAVGEDGNTSA